MGSSKQKFNVQTLLQLFALHTVYRKTFLQETYWRRKILVTIKSIPIVLNLEKISVMSNYTESGVTYFVSR